MKRLYLLLIAYYVQAATLAYYIHYLTASSDLAETDNFDFFGFPATLLLISIAIVIVLYLINLIGAFFLPKRENPELFKSTIIVILQNMQTLRLCLMPKHLGPALNKTLFLKPIAKMENIV